jgi:hypothetical protein
MTTPPSVYEGAVSRDYPNAYEMSGPNLKYKHRVHKTRSGYGSKSGNSGTPLRGTPPKGMPRRYRGKTSYK